MPSCYKVAGHYGTKSYEPVSRKVEPGDVALPQGYKIEPVSTGLTFPTGITFDESGNIYVTESGYSYGEIFLPPKLIRIEKDGKQRVVTEGDNNGPWTGVTFHEGDFYISEGGVTSGGRILKATKDGKITRLLEGLPSIGDHHTNGILIKDDYIYFGQGVATNSGVVGPDNHEFGWLSRHPGFHDIPCKDITLKGENFESENPLTEDKKDKVLTGAFVAFGNATGPNEIIKGQLPCSGSLMRIPVAGGPIELVAWGLRNPYGMATAPDGNIFVTDNSYDNRGSRPVIGAGDVLWKIKPDTWYGWPDFSEGEPLESKDYSSRGYTPKALMATYPNTPPKPAAILGVHSSSNGFDFSRNKNFGYEGQAFIAQFGDMAPNVGKLYAPVGFKVIRVNVNTGINEDFATNKGKTNGPASRLGTGGLERPVAAKFDNSGNALYVVDFGIMEITSKGPAPKKQTGVIWKITKI